MSGSWWAAHAALFGVLASWGAYSSLLSPTDAVRVWGAALSMAAAALYIYGFRTSGEKATATALGLAVVAYIPAALATAQPTLLLLGFTSLALMAALMGSALPLAAPMDRQRILANAGTVTNPGAKLFATIATTTIASFLLSVLLLNGGLLLALGQAPEWSILLAALAVLAVVAILATLPRGLSGLPRVLRTGTKARRP